MQPRTSYTADEVAACRRAVDARLFAWDRLARAMRGADDAQRAALAALAPGYFAALVVMVEHAFADRAPALNPIDGTALDEVRTITESLIRSDGVMTLAPASGLHPETSVLGLVAGDRIALSEDDFRRLADAFFTQLEATYLTP